MASDQPALLVLQHIACEPPAAYEDEMRARGVELHRVELDEGDGLPDWRPFDGIVAMGGPMSAYDDADHDWLVAEKRLIAEAVQEGMPYWGVCLGAQLLAASLGAPVYRGPVPEVGVLSVEVTGEAAADPVFRDAPPEMHALQWHSDTYELPYGALRLARSDAYEQQAFVYKAAYALQFHLEVSPDLAAEWAQVPAYAESLQQLQGEGAASRLVENVRRHADTTIPLARALFRRWLDAVVLVRRGSSTAAA